MIYFEKRNNLERYNLKVVMHSIKKERYGYGNTKMDYDECRGLEFLPLCTMLKHVRANITVKVSDNTGHTDTEGKHYGMIEDVMSGTVDIAMNLYFLRDYWKMQAYPFHDDVLKIISLKKTVKHFDTFLQIFNIKSFALLIATCCVFVTSLKYVLQQSASEAALNFVRMFVSAATLKQPEKLSKKIFFLVLMLAAFTISSHVQSRLSAINTVPNHVPTIDSITDLVHSDHTIYGLSSHKELILNEEVHKRQQIMNNFTECLDRFRKNEHIVCIFSKVDTKYYLYENQTFHISKGNVADRLATYTFAVNSPPLHKFNSILSRMREGGFVELYTDREERYFSKNVDGNYSKNSLTMDHVIAAFCILIVGWIIAILGFLVEITVYAYKNCKLSTKVRSRFTRPRVVCIIRLRQASPSRRRVRFAHRRRVLQTHEE